MFKKHDPVYFYFTGTGSITKVYGYVWKHIRDVYLVIDNAGKEWVMYEEELRMAQKISFKTA